MAFSLFVGDWADNLPEETVAHTAVVLLGQNILWTTLISVCVNELAKKYDARQHGGLLLAQLQREEAGSF